MTAGVEPPVRTSRMVCAGCNAALADDDLAPFVCPRASSGDDIDHVLHQSIDGLSADEDGWAFSENVTEGANEPFVRFRGLFHWYHLARRGGVSDAEYVELTRDLDARVATADGRETGFRFTPYLWSEPLRAMVKDETHQVGSSHKARHLMGVALALEVASRLGGPDGDRPLAIASCGNAALAAAVVAKALGRELRVFVPPWARASITERLDSLGAIRVVCERAPEMPPGDPCFHRYRDAVAAGALPFSVQGPENGLVIPGGATLGWELVVQSRAKPLDRLVIQVGGGALASSTFQALELAHELGALPTLPRLDVVQSDNAHPLVAAWRALAGTALGEAAHHRSRFMKPWPEEPKSLASGILDDETYDWLGIARGLRHTGGEAFTASEEELARAQAEGRAAGYSVCATGSAGYAGLLGLRERGEVARGEVVGVLFTGYEP